MLISTQHHVPNTTPSQLRAALLDPDHLGRCLPHVREVDPSAAPTLLMLKLHLPLGHLDAHTYHVQVTSEAAQAPKRHQFTFQVTDSEGVKLLENGQGKVTLTPKGEDTAVEISLTAKEHGMFAEVGPLLLETMARSAVRQLLENSEKLFQQSPTALAEPSRAPSTGGRLPHPLILAGVPLVLFWLIRKLRR